MRNPASTIVFRAGWIVAAALAGFIVAAQAGLVQGGPLDPPAAPGSTDGVRRPGTPISSVPFTITQPGAYYLTRNVSYSGVLVGVTIAASGVDFDLGGFTISTVGGTSGVNIAGGQDDIRVHNGDIVDFFYGVAGTGIPDVTVTDIRIRTTGPGISLGDRSMVRNCEVTSANSDGINLQAEGIISSCIVDAGNAGIITGAGSIVSNCTVSGATNGISVGTRSVIDSCTVTVPATSTVSAVVISQFGKASDLTVNGSGQHGILLGLGASVDGCSVAGPVLDGINNTSGFASISNCVIDSAGDDGMSIAGRSIIRDSVVRNSGKHGIQTEVGSIVRGNAVTGSGQVTPATSNGIRVSTGSMVLDNAVRSNLGDGIRTSGAGNLVRGNDVSGNTLAGITAPPGGNTIVENSARDNGTDLADLAINVTGELITTVNDGTNTIPVYNYTP